MTDERMKMLANALAASVAELNRADANAALAESERARLANLEREADEATRNHREWKEHHAENVAEERRYHDAMVAAVRDGFALLAAAVREGNS